MSRPASRVRWRRAWSVDCSRFRIVWLGRLVFERGLAVIYLVAFATTYSQFPALLGEHGLLPAKRWVKRVPFVESPSIFHFRCSDRFARGAALAGIALSMLELSGLPDRAPFVVSAATWIALSWLYLSFVNVGQTFYAFGWESMLVEAGFFAAFLGPERSAPSLVPFWVLRWMLFRTEVGAGLIKLRHDECWRNLTCLYWHYETQPLPNALSAHFHRMPKPIHRAGVAFSHVVQIVVPFGVFAPQPWASVAAALIAFHQLLLIVSGNYSWLNWLTVVLSITAMSDQFLHHVLPIATPALEPLSPVHQAVLFMLAGAVVVLSIRPAMNLLSKDQLMNYSYNPLHLVNAYGAFGRISRERFEVTIEGTTDDEQWKEYEFKAKPGDPKRKPRQVAPYHLRLDWLMWFLPFSVEVRGQRVLVGDHDVWFLRFIEKLLRNDARTLALMRHNPFPDAPPKRIRARYWKYRFATKEERAATGDYWHRTLLGEYLPPLAASDLERLAT
jgi:hypothetical protein